MNIICQKEILLENLNLVLKAVSTRTTLPILECTLISAKDGVFKMYSNDLEMCVETSAITSQILEDGAIAIDAKMFYEIIRRMPVGDISIKTDEKNLMVIKSDKSEFKIAGMTANDFPSLPEVPKIDPCNIKATALKNMIVKTIFSVALDDTRPAFTGELFEVSSGKLELVAVDGFRISLASEEVSGNDMSVIIPSKTLNEISKILPTSSDDVIEIYFSDKHLMFKTDKFIVVSRLIEGEFLKYEQVFVNDYKTKLIVDRRSILESLDRVSLLGSKEIKKTPIKIQIKNNFMVVTSNTEIGDVTDEMNVDVDGEDMEISFNPKFLIDAIKAIDQDKVEIMLTSSLSPCVIHGEADDKNKYLVLPLRLVS